MTGNRIEGGPGYGLLQEVRGYWDALRPAGGLPERAGIDPRGLERALEHVFLIERIAPGLGRFRIAGMHLTVLMGMEVRGMPLSALFDPAARERLHGILEQVFSGPSLVELALEGERGIGRPGLEGRMILLPVRGDGGVCDRALGCLVTVGPVGRTPRRFAIARQVTEDIDATTHVAPPVEMPARQPGFAEPAPTFSAPGPAAPRPVAPGVDPRRAHLRLVKSDD